MKHLSNIKQKELFWKKEKTLSNHKNKLSPVKNECNFTHFNIPVIIHISIRIQLNFKIIFRIWLFFLKIGILTNLQI